MDESLKNPASIGLHTNKSGKNRIKNQKTLPILIKKAADIIDNTYGLEFYDRAELGIQPA